MDDFEFEIEWIPEESSKPYEIDMANVVIDTPSHIVDKLCKKKSTKNKIMNKMIKYS